MRGRSLLEWRPFSSTSSRTLTLLSLPFFGSIGIIEHDGKFAPLFRAANTDVNVPLSIAIMSFIFVETWGMRALGASHYLSEFINFRQMS